MTNEREVVAMSAPAVTASTDHPDPRPASPVRLDGRLDPALSRWRWLVKWLLAVPHLLVLGALWAATLVLTVVAAVAILVTGTYPRPLFEFTTGVLRWTWRVQFYGFDVLATDRYPPFSLDPDPGYPADLAIDHPPSLSRGLVLVKSWLLALPHLLIVLAFAGVPFWLVRDLPWSLLAGGLIGLLTLAAMAALLVGGRYPPSLFDLVMGLNRWVYRVLAYVLLMTDEYPPFRLDPGGRDPGTVPEPAPEVAPPAAVQPPPSPAGERRSGIVLTVLGVVLVAAALAMWWLVETTNPSGDHDAELLPLLAAIPLLIGLFHLVRAHVRERRHP
jgi:hypothetical protein